jgi:hypothetical protein
LPRALEERVLGLDLFDELSYLISA